MTDDPTTSGTPALLRWPAQRGERDRLADLRRPRVLLVAMGADPPPLWDPVEDWVREPVDGAELEARCATVLRRARRLARTPRLDAEGLVWSADRWVHLGDAQRAAAGALVARFGQVVATADLAAAVAAAGGSDHPGAMRALALRLRERFEELELRLHTLKGRGLMLTFPEESPAGAALTSGSPTVDVTSSSVRRGGGETVA